MIPVAALVVGGLTFLLVVLLTGEDEVAGGSPQEVSADQLRALARETGSPVYWIGERPGERMELTTNDRGHVYVRYLPEAVEVGDPRPGYTTIATYPVPDALAAARKGEASGRVERRAKGGGVAIYYRARPTSVYLAYRGRDVLVEVFDPRTGAARKLALSGNVRPVG